jgi:transcription-repair coupling factor (superfamily II helicase)
MDAIRQALRRTPSAQRAVEQLTTLRPGRALHLLGAPGSLPILLLQEAYQQEARPIWVLVPTEEEAQRWATDALTLGWDLVHLPESGIKPYDPEQLPDPTATARRWEALHLLSGRQHPLLVSSISAAIEKAPGPETFQQQGLHLRPGTPLKRDNLLSWLRAHGFVRVDFVREIGSFAARGGIVDVFPHTSTEPIRIEFLGEEIDTLRTFDPDTQRSTAFLQEAVLLPLPEAGTAGQGSPIWTYLHEPVLVVLYGPELIKSLWRESEQTIWEAYEHAVGEANLPPEMRYVGTAELEQWLRAQAIVCTGPLSSAGAEEERIDLQARPHPETHGQLSLLRAWLKEHLTAGYEVHIAAGSPLEVRRMTELLGDHPHLHVEPFTLSGGFTWPEARLAVLTAHEIFRRPPRLNDRTRSRMRVALRNLEELRPGDYVVHIDYGIGRFAGLDRITVQDAEYEVVRVLYRDGDVLYVPFHSLHKLQKYRAREGDEPRLTRLGSPEWELTKRRTKQRLKDLTRDLVRLYAQRRASTGYAFSPDTEWQLELETSFPFEDTPDQARATAEVKADMERPIPMDRLLCGDVGFGKTEIAVRAAFKAVQDGKQVAVLVPTTILAHQHYRTFSERLARFPVRIEVISRFVPSRRLKAILEDTRRGLVDILIGTHRLLSRDVAFKDLGLLIIDEEHRFGVAAKEQLRQLRVNVDTLLLTATPIPRTLQLALMGIRDMSLLTTPPPNRLPVHTEVHAVDPRLIRRGIVFELNRGGQVFFVHNRVSDIESVAEMVRRIVPEARVAVAHGQLPPQKLEAIMYRFMEGHYDVLVCTNIIESGLDLPNVNTIFIHNAHRFGLAELHQLRGRVGRSDRQAYCYLLTPPLGQLSREARDRLQAIELFTDPGSGLQIALRDLDIRGAGNLLGAEQSGFIAEVGLEMYYQLLEEALQELRQEELQEDPHIPVAKAPEATIELDLPTYLPSSYVENPNERFRLYRRLATASDEGALEEIEAELRDRFGPLPDPARYLLEAVRLKQAASRAGFTRLSWKKGRLTLEIPPPEQTEFYQSPHFEAFLEALRRLDRPYRFRQKEKCLLVHIERIGSLCELWEALHTLTNNPTPTPP